MYRKQMILQRITSYLLLACAALVFIYSLGIMTDLYDSLYLVSSYKPTHFMYVEGSSIYFEMQDFNKALTAAGIVLILSAVALFVFKSHDRRKYYIANYLTIGLNAVLNIGVAVWGLMNVLTYKTQYLTTVDFAKLKELSEMLPGSFTYTDSTFWFDIGWAVFIPLLLVTALSIGCLIWKITLMNAERRLVEEGKEA